MTRAMSARGSTLRDTSRADKSSARSKDLPAGSPKASADGYWQRSETPLTSLAFVLPLIVIYAVGTRGDGPNPIVAFTILQRSVERAAGAFLGVYHRWMATPEPHHAPAHLVYLPAILVVAFLLIVHVARKDPWRIVWGDLLRMALESVVLAVPLLILWFAAAPFLARLPLFASPRAIVSMAIPCVGAGVYEELIFRFIAFNVLSILLSDILGMRPSWVYGITICLSAVGFSAYHYLGYEQFSPITFVFRTIAGLYFAAVYLCRGFGVTCGCHASYDAIVVCMQFMH